MLIQNSTNSQNFTALNIHPKAKTAISKMSNDIIIKLEKAGEEFENYRYTNMSINEKGTPKVAMEWHNVEFEPPFSVKRKDTSLEITGKSLRDNLPYKAGEEQKEILNFDNEYDAYKVQKDISGEDKNPVTATINLTKALENSIFKTFSKIEKEKMTPDMKEARIDEIMNKHTKKLDVNA